MAEKRAPVQGWAEGIPWSLHLEAYSVYCKKYGAQEALITGCCRGGFGTGELDMFVPGWRDRVSRLTALETALRSLIRDYVNLLELSRDRIISLGGTCDSVSVMESGDPALIRAKAVLTPSAGGDEHG